VVVGLELSADGLGQASFGAGADGVLAYVQAILGEPTADSGWVDAHSTGEACPGTEVRKITWNDLILTFGDSSPYAEGIQHFSGYTYGPAFGPQIDPYGRHRRRRHRQRPEDRVPRGDRQPRRRDLGPVVLHPGRAVRLPLRSGR